VDVWLDSMTAIESVYPLFKLIRALSEILPFFEPLMADDVVDVLEKAGIGWYK